MKIALIRGPSLNPWEWESFKSLRDRHAVTYFSTSYTPYWTNPGPELPLVRCFWPDVWLSYLPSSAGWFMNGVSSRLLGTSFYMQGLGNRLKGYDILHSLETYNTFTYQTLQAKRRQGGKLVVTVWETLPHRGENHSLRAWRKQQVLQEADAFHAVTERARDMLIAEGVRSERIHVIPMGIDTQHFSPQPRPAAWRQRWGMAPDDFLLICVARWVEEKGIFDLLAAMDILQKATLTRHVRLVFIGRGPEEKRMKAMIRSRGLSSRVVLAGPVSYPEMPQAYASADASILPSKPSAVWEEQFGYALVESMAMGLPLISTRSGAIPEVIGDAGLLVEPGNPREVSQAIQRILADSSLARNLSVQGRERALERYTGAQTAASLERLYNLLMQGANR